MPIHDWTRVYAGIFHDFHHAWISTIKHALNQGLLPPDYYALAEQTAADNGSAEQHSSNGGIALDIAPPRVRFTASAEAEAYARKRNRIAIHHVSDDEVVALIEIVSPGNTASRHALRAFVDKSLEFLEAGVHLLVLDLFPPGPRDPQGIHAAIWSEISDDDFRLPPDKPLTLASYSAGYVKRAFIEPVALADELPPMPLFLEAEVYIPVPLEATYRTAFAAVPKRWRDELDPSPNV